MYSLCLPQVSLDSGRASARHSTAQLFSVPSITLGTATLSPSSSSSSPPSSSPSVSPSSHRLYDGCFAGLTINVQRVNLVTVINSSSLMQYTVHGLNAEIGCTAGMGCDHNTTVCPVNHVCRSRWRTHSCVCKDGFLAGEWGKCFDPCDPNPCQNGGECVGGKCRCPPGFRGAECSVAVNAPCALGLHSPPTCSACRCDWAGTRREVCDGSGVCLCDVSACTTMLLFSIYTRSTLTLTHKHYGQRNKRKLIFKCKKATKLSKCKEYKELNKEQ